MKKASTGVGLLELGFIATGIGIIFWYFSGHADKGEDLWPALGFSYGPIGNLPMIGADFRTGSNRFDGHNALPLVQQPQGKIQGVLTDTLGNVLTSFIGATPLTDATSSGVPITQFPVVNNFQSRVNYRSNVWPSNSPTELGTATGDTLGLINTVNDDLGTLT